MQCITISNTGSCLIEITLFKRLLLWWSVPAYDIKGNVTVTTSYQFKMADGCQRWYACLFNHVLPLRVITLHSQNCCNDTDLEIEISDVGEGCVEITLFKRLLRWSVPAYDIKGNGTVTTSYQFKMADGCQRWYACLFNHMFPLRVITLHSRNCCNDTDLEIEISDGEKKAVF